MLHFLSYNVIFEFVLINWERNRTLLGGVCKKKHKLGPLFGFLLSMAQLILGYVGIKDQSSRSRTTNKEYLLFSRVSFCYSTDKDRWSWNAWTRIFVLFLFNFASLQQTITTSPWNNFRVGICFLAHNISTIWLKGLKISWCLNQIWAKFGLSSMIGKFNFAKYFITQRLLWEGMAQQKRAHTKNF